MQYDADTPDAYLALLADDWRRERLLAIRKMILEVVPDVAEGIGYGMLRYESGGNVVAHLNAQKGYVGLYLGDVAKIDPAGEFSAGLNCGKGCVRVRKRDDLEKVHGLLARKVDLLGEA